MRLNRRQLRNLLLREVRMLVEEDKKVEKIGPASNFGFIGAQIEKAGNQKDDYDFYGPSSLGQYIALPKGEEPTGSYRGKKKNPTAQQLNHRSVGGPSKYFKD